MRKQSQFVFTLILFIIFTGISLFSQTITLTAPTAGAQWCRGKQYAITWNKVGNMNPSIKIRLHDSTGNNLLVITPSAPNSGSYKWMLPNTLAAGSYTIHIRTIDDGVSANSAPFTIKNCNPTSTISPNPNNISQQPPSGIRQPTVQDTVGDFELVGVTRMDSGALIGNLRHHGSKPFNGLLAFQVKAGGHNEKIPIQINMPAGGSKQVDLVWTVPTRDLVEKGGTMPLEVTVNPDKIPLETNYANNTVRITMTTTVKIFVDGITLEINPVRNQNGPYPLNISAKITMRAIGNGQVILRVLNTKKNLSDVKFNVSASGTYGTFIQTINLTPLEEWQVRDWQKNPNFFQGGCGPSSVGYQFYVERAGQSEVMGLSRSNTILGCYSYTR